MRELGPSFAPCEFWGSAMVYFLLPTLLLAGLAWWIFDDFGQADDGAEERDVDLTDGDDSYSGTDDHETINAMDGSDTVYGNDGTDTLRMAQGDDYGAGGKDDDTISGGAGNDVLNGGNGNDVIRGEGGSDILSSNLNNLAKATDVAKAFDEGDLAKARSFFSNNTISDQGNDDLGGGAGHDLITDFAGDNHLRGGTGNDLLMALDKGSAAGAGVDTLDGGMGIDRLQGDDGDIMIGGEGQDKFDVLVSDTGQDRAVSITDFEQGERIRVFIENAPDNTSLNLVHDGNLAKLYSGNQLLLQVNAPDAQAFAAVQQGIVFGNTGASLAGGTQLTGNADSWTGTQNDDVVRTLGGNDSAYGALGNDTISLGRGDDYGRGGAGNDDITGAPGADLLNGGQGNDVIHAGSQSDVLSSSVAYFDRFAGNLYLNQAQKDFMRAELVRDENMSDGGNDSLYGGAGNDLITDFAGDNLLNGSLGNDVLSALDDGTAAGTGVDTLEGGYGNDWLQGDDGDQMTGGANKDAFNVMYSASTDRAVQINDFEQGETVRIVIPGAPNGAALSFATNGSDAQISYFGQLVAVVKNIDTAAELAALQSSTTLVSA